MDKKNVKITNYEKIEDTQKNKIKNYIIEDIKINRNARLHQNETISNNEKKNKLYNSNNINIIRGNINVEYNKNSLSNKMINLTQNKILNDFSKNESNVKNSSGEKNAKYNMVMKNKSKILNDNSQSSKVNYSDNNNEHLLYNKNENTEKHYCVSGNTNIMLSCDHITYKNDLNLKETNNYFDLNRKRKMDVEEKLSSKTNIHNNKIKKYDYINPSICKNPNIFLNSSEMSKFTNNKNIKNNNNDFLEKMGALQNNLDKVKIGELSKEIFSLSNRSLSNDKKNEENAESNNIISNIKRQGNNKTCNKNKSKKTETKYTDNTVQSYNNIKSNNLKYIKNVYDYDDGKCIENKNKENNNNENINNECSSKENNNNENNFLPLNIHEKNEENIELNKNFINEEKWNFKEKINMNESKNIVHDYYLENKNRFKKSNELIVDKFSENTINDSICSTLNINNKNDSHRRKGYIQDLEVAGGDNEILKKKNGNKEINYSNCNFSNSVEDNDNSQKSHYINNIIDQNKKDSIHGLNDNNNVNNHIKSKEKFIIDSYNSCNGNPIVDEKKTSEKVSVNILDISNSNNLTEQNKFEGINYNKGTLINCMKQENENTSIYIENSYNTNKKYSKGIMNINKDKGCISMNDLNYRNNRINNKEIDGNTNNNFKQYSGIYYGNSINEKDNDSSHFNLNNEESNKCISMGTIKNFNRSNDICNSNNEYKSCIYNKINFNRNEDKNKLSKMIPKEENINCSTNTENISKEKKNYRNINLFNEIQHKYKKKLKEDLNLLKSENMNKDIQVIDICSNKELTTIESRNIKFLKVEKNSNNANIENEEGLLKKGVIIRNKQNSNANYDKNNFDDRNDKKKLIVDKCKNSSSIICSNTNLVLNKKINSELKTIKKNFKANNKSKILSNNKINSCTISNTCSYKTSSSKFSNNKNDKYVYSSSRAKKNNNSSSFIHKFNKKVNDINNITSSLSNVNNVLENNKYANYKNMNNKNYPKNLNVNKDIGIYNKQNLNNFHLEKNKSVYFASNEKEQKKLNNCGNNDKIVKLKNQSIKNIDKTSEEIKNKNLNDNKIINEEIKNENLNDNKIINEEIKNENLNDNKIINEEIKNENLNDNKIYNEEVKNKDILNNGEVKNEKHVDININKKLENNLIKKKVTESEKISNNSISDNSSKSLKGNINLKRRNGTNIKNINRWNITSSTNVKLSNNIDIYKNKKKVNKNNNNNMINKNNTNISYNTEFNKSKHIISTTITTSNNNNNVIRNKYKANIYNKKESHIKRLNIINREKGNYIEARKKNIYDYNNNKCINKNNFKDIINEEMEKYKSSKKYKLKSNSIPPSTQKENNNNKNIFIKNGKQVEYINKKEKINKNIVLKKQSNSCDNTNKSLEKIKRDNSEKKYSNSSSNNEKKEISYFEWLAKEKKKKEEEVERQKKKINDAINEEENLMLQPLSAFNLKQNEKIYEQGDFIVDKHPIGNGRTGLVFKAIIKKENEKVALKVMAKDTILTLNIERQVLKEIIIQASLKHINILQLIAYFEDKTRLFLILELANGGSIRNKMKLKSQPLKEEQVALYVYQIADALSYLHNFNIIHRDLKPDNILIHYSDEYSDNKIYKYGIIKLADFGFSCQLKNKRQKRSTFCGTVDYMPPEIINQMPYDCNVDLWCLGIVIFELLVGFPPFTDDTQERIFNQIKELNFHFPKTVSLTAQELILKLCSRTAEERICAEEVKSHPWIKQFL
ncbi:serine/threonine protein kinase, putative [Plasmodium relictum]|uniref:Aurora kinase n=1 Tax=Plasmodium relictum TaxID=85471 RepID=A0A1J1H4J0_PLARL|nr:serine/threonine protein kinase, putative [Plasmodium relictum]CRG99836.1 serine/threonine protein kinase, putative [Plasmodium relictum]